MDKRYFPAIPIVIAGGVIAGARVLCAQAAPAGSTVSGLVQDRATGRPIPFANVSIDGGGAVTLGTREGRFSLPNVASGARTLLVRQIGFIPQRVGIIVAGGPVTVPTIQLEHIPVSLDTVRVAGPGECTVRGFANSSIAPDVRSLFEQVENNASQFRAVGRQFAISVTYVRRRWQVTSKGDTVNAKLDTVRQRTSDSSAKEYVAGNILDYKVDSAGHGSYSAAMPGFGAIASVTFQDHHCFRYAGVDRSTGNPAYRIDFVPTADVKGPDVSGSIFLDQQTFVLRRVQFDLVNPPKQNFPFSTLQSVVEYREIVPYIAMPFRLDVAEKIENVKTADGAAIVRGGQANRMVSCVVTARDSTVGAPPPCGGG